MSTNLGTQILTRNIKNENNANSDAIVFFRPNFSIIIIVITTPGNSASVVNNKSR
jgi:hypothetical protein